MKSLKLCNLASLGALVFLGMTLPASAENYYVASGDVYGPLGLVSAINAANITNTQLDTIYLEAGTYVLDRVNNSSPDFGATGLPSITSPITINGVGTDGSTVIKRDSASAFRIFHIAKTGNLKLESVTVSRGTLALEPPKVWGGGGIFNQGTVFLNNDTFRDNWVPSDSESDPWCCNGGAILNDSTGQMTVMNSRLIGDYTDANYHALFGGLVSNAGKLSLNSTIVSNAVANYGGGIFNEGDLDVINTTIFNTHGSIGGAIYNRGSINLLNSTISNNQAHYVGGIYSEGVVSINSSTIYRNYAFDHHMAVNLEAYGGTITVHNTIVADPRLCSVSCDLPTTTGPNCFGFDGKFISLGHNVASNVEFEYGCPFNETSDLSNLLPTDLKIDPVLKNNGGPTPTHALLSKSPAIDAGDEVCHPRDQRGAIRPQDGDNNSSAVCDIGAYEVGVLTTLDQVQVNGDASKEQPFLRLTPDEPSKTGSAFLPTAFTLTPNSVIHSRFALKIGGANLDGPLGSDGLAFVIHNDPRGASSLGNGGEGLGFGINDTGGNPLSAISPSLAIEFDTHHNSFPERSSGDPDGNHFAVIKNGEVFNHIAYDSPALSLNDGSPRYVWVDYVGVSKQLEVFMSTTDVKPVAPIISTDVDLAANLGNKAYFGFTAGTGGGFNSHDILAWKLDVVSSPSVGDFNGDSCVDQSDLSTLMAVVTKSGAKPLVYDLNGDGKVNIADSRKLVTLFTNPRGVACK